MAQGQVHSVLFEGGENYYGSPDNLQFYTSTYGDPSTAYSAQTNAGYYTNPYPGYHGGSTGGFWSAFGTGGFDDEPPLLEGMFFFSFFF
jgi:hypothetical protein